jgi:hypothetical protein
VLHDAQAAVGTSMPAANQPQVGAGEADMAEHGGNEEAPASGEPGLPTKGVIAGNDHRDHRSKL